MGCYVVTDAMVNARIKDAVGTYVLHGFYEAAILPDDVHPDDVEKLVRKGMIAVQGSPEADAASPVGKRVQFDDNGMPMSPAQVAEAAKKLAARSAVKPEEPGKVPPARQSGKS